MQLVHCLAIFYSLVYFLAIAITWVTHPGGDQVYMSDAVGLVFGASSMFVLPGLMVSGLLFILWMARSYHNVTALGGTTSQSPRSMVVEWFIPLINLFAPLKSMREIWQGCDPAMNPAVDEVLEPGAEPEPWSLGLVDGWWAFWILSNVLERVTNKVDDPLSEYFAVEALPLHLLTAVFWGVGAYFVIRVVGRVTDAQYEQLRRADIEVETVRRQRWGVISLLLMPFGMVFCGIAALLHAVEVAGLAVTASLGFASTAIAFSIVLGLVANWNNSPKPAAGVLGLYLGFFNVLVLFVVTVYVTVGLSL